MSEQQKSINEKYCHECGDIIRAKAEICPKCGVRQSYSLPGMGITTSIIGAGNPRSKTTAGLLGIFLGGLGIHQFYMGRPIVGILYVIFIWTFIPSVLGFIEGINYLTMSEKVFSNRHSGPAWSPSQKNTPTNTVTPTPETHVKCPDCKELILKEARVCKHCGCKMVVPA